jgi:hypothetical protein
LGPELEGTLKLDKESPFPVKVEEVKVPWTTLTFKADPWEERGIVTVSEGSIKV